MDGKRTWCRKHPHSTEQGSKACYIKALQKRVDRRLGLHGQPPVPDPRRPLRHTPPRLVRVGFLELLVWSEDANTAYGGGKNPGLAGG